MELVCNKLGFPNLFVVDSVGNSGGLTLFWGDDIVVDIQNFNQRHINEVVKNQNLEVLWKFMGFYGQLDVTKRYEAWNLLKF
jgi:hypothetical protein